MYGVCSPDHLSAAEKGCLQRCMEPSAGIVMLACDAFAFFALLCVPRGSIQELSPQASQ